MTYMCYLKSHWPSPHPVMNPSRGRKAEPLNLNWNSSEGASCNQNSPHRVGLRLPHNWTSLCAQPGPLSSTSTTLQCIP